MSTRTTIHGDLNNSEAMRRSEPIVVDPSWAGRSLAIPADQDDATVRARYRPFLLPEAIASNDWVAKLELSTATKMAAEDLARTGGDRLKVLVLYGSQRERSYSRLLAYEQARILFRLGCDVRVYDPTGLPIKDDVQHEHPKVQELRNLSKWSDGHLWVSPEQHGILVSLRALEAVMPSTISSFTDLLPSRRPPYSRTRSTGSH
jgi:arsenic resistance protein ArsH